MASRIIAQLLVAGGTTLLRAAGQAWGQALQNAQRSGVAAEAVQQATRAGGMLISEAQMILGVKEGVPYSEVMKRYKHLFEANEKQGSFYLQSKVYRAWEALDQEYKAKGLKPEGDEQQAGQQQQSQQQQQQQKDERER